MVVLVEVEETEHLPEQGLSDKVLLAVRLRRLALAITPVVAVVEQGEPESAEMDQTRQGMAVAELHPL